MEGIESTIKYKLNRRIEKSNVRSPFSADVEWYTNISRCTQARTTKIGAKIFAPPTSIFLPI